MSHKIEVTLDSYTLGSRAARQAAVTAFGVKDRDLQAHYHRGTSMTLLATLEQFGLFVALRNDLGGTNAIKALQPRIIAPPPPPPTRLDVTQYQLTF